MNWTGAHSPHLPISPGVVGIMIVCAIFVLALTDYKFASQPVSAAQWYQPTANDVRGKLKRSTEGQGCQLPSPLKNGVYSPSKGKCSSQNQKSTPYCNMVPGTQVSENGIIWYECNPGFTIQDNTQGDTTEKRPTFCRSGQWSPPLPVCVESSYNSQNSPQFLSSSSYCGKPANYSRINNKVQGIVSGKGAWPWMVIFGVRQTTAQNGGIHWFCAGTLVTTRHILSTAHCFQQRRDNIFARFNDLDLNSAADDEGIIEVEIQRNNIVIHPAFKRERVYTHNLAIIKLNEDLPVTDFVRPICLPTPDFSEKTFHDDTIYFASWGQTDDNHKFKPKLLEAEGTVVNYHICAHNYKSYQSEEFVVVDWKLICASIPLNRNCRGDTGSPLMLKTEDKYVLIGVVATPYRCFAEQFPRLFTRMSNYMDWVLANLKL